MKKIVLLPEDFDFNEDTFDSTTNCPLAKACQRHFKRHVTVGIIIASVHYSKDLHIVYEIPEGFRYENYKSIKSMFKRKKITSWTVLLKPL